MKKTNPGPINLSTVKKRDFEGVALRFLPLSARKFGFTVLHESVPAFTDTPPNLHKHTWEFVFVLAGRADAYLDSRHYSLKKGDMFSIPAGVYHRFKTGKSSLAAISVFSPPINFRKPDVHVLNKTKANDPRKKASTGAGRSK